VATGKARIGDLLVEDRLITRAQLAEAVALQKDKGGKLVENLIVLHHLEPHSFVGFLARQPGIASIDLQNYTIPSIVIDLVDGAFARKHEILPIDTMGKVLTVGMACPLDVDTVKQLEEMTHLKVRSLLASSEEIRLALNRYYPVPLSGQDIKLAGAGRETMVVAQKREEGGISTNLLKKVESALTFEGIVRLAREVKSLPALPETVKEIQKATRDTHTSTTDVAHIISKDPALSAKLIGLANSAAFSFSHHIDNIELAVTLLGLRETYSVVLASSVINYFDSSKHFDFNAFWRRSIIAGIAARKIARLGKLTDDGSAFAAGLLHDLGRLVFTEIASERYGEIDQGLSDDALVELEHKHFGIAHPELGYVLAKEWGLPVEITEPMRLHHGTGRTPSVPVMSSIVRLAAKITDKIDQLLNDDSYLEEFVPMCDNVAETLKLQKSQLKEIVQEIRDRLEHDDEH
jgi:HD-like signal output (HDOD) protein